MTEHTSEPWKNGHHGDLMPEGHIVDLNGRLIANCMGSINTSNPNHDKENRANARRIVAAVNACAGIPTEELEWVARRKGRWVRLNYLSEVASEYAPKENTP